MLLEDVRSAEAKCARLADERKRAESARDGLLAAEKAAAAEITRQEALLASARSNLANATIEIMSATTESEKAISREETARAEVATKDQALADARRARKEAEAALQALNEHGVAISANASSLHFEEQLRALEAGIADPSSSAAVVTNVAPTPVPVPAMSEFEKRVAERRAADAARSAAK